ncbi:HET-domain-containing protein [Ophiobolus disseminans]|uniref:HET-domain-containing protein n=1 Tax=Ophiobolus disseminans TaxID=1469910 RepID=A0A6A7A268_9PLEO|nr:HET-domain-containing protein [Ophiobolus disseminans]
MSATLLPRDYTYKPLDKSAEIRIVVLQAAPHFESPLAIRLQHCDLAERLQDDKEELDEDWTEHIRRQELAKSQWTGYEAVSYAWGTEAATVVLEVLDDEAPATLMIRPNVETMLKHLRSKTNDRCLWIDAICINQQDDREKERQVQFMGKIFSSAKAVLAWLGASTDALEKCDQLFRDLRRAVASQVEDGHGSMIDAQVLQDLLARPWFRRRWIVQEVLLAREAIVVCGNHTIDFMIFVNSVWKLTQEGRHDWLPADVVRKLCTVYRFRQSFFYRGRAAILALLVVFHAAECADDRDRIYALDGITDWKIPVSYLDPAEGIYLRYAATHIEYGNSALLNCSGAFRSSTHVLPSWVPDWRVAPRFMPVTTGLTFKNKDIFDGNVRYTGSKATLRFRGKAMAQVIAVGASAPFQAEDADLLPLLVDWSSLCPTDLLREFIATITLGSVEQVHTTATINDFVLDFLLQASGMWQEDRHLVSGYYTVRILLRSLVFSKRVWSAFDLTLYSTIFGGLGRRETGDVVSTGPLSQSPQTFARVLRHTIGGRRCFLTKNGTFGLGPADTQPGDIVISVPSAVTPYVLRPEPDKWLVGGVGSVARYFGRREYHTLVGDCYVHWFAMLDAPSRGLDKRCFNII